MIETFEDFREANALAGSNQRGIRLATAPHWFGKFRGERSGPVRRRVSCSSCVIMHVKLRTMNQLLRSFPQIVSGAFVEIVLRTTSCEARMTKV